MWLFCWDWKISLASGGQEWVCPSDIPGPHWDLVGEGGGGFPTHRNRFSWGDWAPGVCGPCISSIPFAILPSVAVGGIPTVFLESTYWKYIYWPGSYWARFECCSCGKWKLHEDCCSMGQAMLWLELAHDDHQQYCGFWDGRRMAWMTFLMKAVAAWVRPCS